MHGVYCPLRAVLSSSAEPVDDSTTAGQLVLFVDAPNLEPLKRALEDRFGDKPFTIEEAEAFTDRHSLSRGNPPEEGSPQAARAGGAARGVESTESQDISTRDDSPIQTAMSWRE
jgi:hypothetical protein